jgi:hypothetical protein
MAQCFSLDKPRALQWAATGVGIVVSFCGLLRPGEWCQLRARDVEIIELNEGGFAAILALVLPKNASSMGRTQTAVIRDVIAVRWLGWLVSGLPGPVLLQPGGTLSFGRFFRSALAIAGLSDSGLTPGSQRPGGTTDMFLQGAEISRLRILGRWKSLQTLDYYIQEASSYRVLHRLPPQSLAPVNQLLLAGRAFRRTPSLPWYAFFSRHAQEKQQALHEAPSGIPFKVVWRQPAI